MDLGSVIGGIGGSLVGGLFNMFGVQQQNELSRAMFNANMNFQQEQADINRAFQDQQRRYQNFWNEKMFARQNEWNSPANQVQLLQDAGINPSALYAGGSASPVGSTTAPSAVSGGSGAMPSAVSSPQMQNPFAAFTNISQVIKDFADAGKLGAETKRLNSLLPREVENYILQNKDLEYSNELKSYDAYVSKNIKDARVRSAWQELTNLQLKAINTQSETDLNKAKSASERLSQLLTDEDINLKKSQVIEMGIRNKNLQRSFDSQFATAISEQERNRAQASEARQSAREIELRNFIEEQLMHGSYNKVTGEFTPGKIDALKMKLQRDYNLSQSEAEDAVQEWKSIIGHQGTTDQFIRWLSTRFGKIFHAGVNLHN